MKNANTAETAPQTPMALAVAARPVDDDGDDWLGCEAMHPLTWLPAAASVDGAQRPPAA